MEAVLEVADGNPPCGELIERPSPRGGMEHSAARWATESLRPSTALPWLERAFALY
jgi:hypothetical protein